MPELGPPANKIEELRRRFEEQPASRIFLQLAEEYRRLGLPEQAIEVLEAGLAKRPGDLSGMVALGRCRLEIGLLEAAVETLEGVIARDAAHLVANKLLIEAHLQLGDAERAGQRLELYKLLNAADPWLAPYPAPTALRYNTPESGYTVQVAEMGLGGHAGGGQLAGCGAAGVCLAAAGGWGSREPA
ncbi:MAG: tetratricopeptide repeat protein, partial [Thermoanaerobaculia bacterium]|nr:tetratricopeptide repeat protein [Thermoanaerobaculia bacterium]